MSESGLRARNILVVEDEFFLAKELSDELTGIGAIVIGPAGTITDALALINTTTRIDGAVLDANLRGEMIFEAADVLAHRKVPFVFATGYDSAVIPSRFSHVVRCEKPVDITKLVQVMERLMHA